MGQRGAKANSDRTLARRNYSFFNDHTRRRCYYCFYLYLFPVINYANWNKNPRLLQLLLHFNGTVAWT